MPARRRISGGNVTLAVSATATSTTKPGPVVMRARRERFLHDPAALHVREQALPIRAAVTDEAWVALVAAEEQAVRSGKVAERPPDERRQGEASAVRHHTDSIASEELLDHFKLLRAPILRAR